MFLTAPTAWGYSPDSWRMPAEPQDSIATWQRRMTLECGQDFRGQFSAWSRISLRDAQSLGDALCAEGRIFWPFVEMRDNETFRQIADAVPAGDHRAMIFGIATGVTRDNSEVLHALRHSLYPSSAMLWRWTDNHAAFNEWLRSNHGGRMGGVIYAEIDGDTPAKIEAQIARAKRAIDFVRDPAREMGEYTLVIDNRVPGLDVREQIEGVRRWIDLAPRDCPALLASRS